jgi:uncharacterized protein YjbJ (UPF0337 family)
MNSDQWNGQWKQVEGEAKRLWGKLTDDDWALAAGDLDKLAGRLQERYGDAREVALEKLGALYQRVTSGAKDAVAR